MQDLGSATVKHTFRPRRTYVPYSKNLLKEQTNKKRIKETQQISSIRLRLSDASSSTGTLTESIRNERFRSFAADKADKN